MEKKISVKLWFGSLALILCLVFAFIIFILLLPKRKVDIIKNATVVVVSEEDKQNCKNWIEETQGQKATFKHVQGTERTTSLNEHILDISGIFIQGKGWNEEEKGFNCIKDIDGVYGKKRNGLFTLQIDGEIIEQDM